MCTPNPTGDAPDVGLSRAPSSSTNRESSNPTLALEVMLARNDLTTFVQQQAAATARRLGFSYEACGDAPCTYQQLRAAFAESIDGGTPLLISDRHCDDSIYLTREDNVRFRFWHDTAHVRLGLSFNLDDELELATWHLQQLQAAGYPRTSLPWRVLHADLVGQIHLMALIGRFPIQQRRFVTDCIEYGLEAGLLEEIRRIPDPDSPVAARTHTLVPAP